MAGQQKDKAKNKEISDLIIVTHKTINTNKKSITCVYVYVVFIFTHT